jgi:hypothetical protein
LVAQPDAESIRIKKIHENQACRRLRRPMEGPDTDHERRNRVEEWSSGDSASINGHS